MSMAADFRLHIAGNRTYVIELARDLVAFDPGYDGRGGPTLRNVATLVEATGKPLSLLFVSHAHGDHVDNLPLFAELGQTRPERYPFALAAHPAGGTLRLPRPLAVERPTTVMVSGERFDLFPTPGHTRELDDLCLFVPRRGLLFVGDLVQPQGTTYECCTFSTPVSNHVRPDLAVPSLEALAARPFTTLLMGHDGTLLDEEAGLAAIRLTLHTLRRSEALVREFARRNRHMSVDALTEQAFDRIAAERGLTPAQVEIRKIEGHGGPCARLGSKSFYHLYDAPSIRWYAKAALA